MNSPDDFHLDLTGIGFDDAVKSDYQWPMVKDPLLRVYELYGNPRVMLTDDWLQARSLEGIDISSIMVFYKPANWKMDVAHVDVVKQDPTGAVVSAINWIPNSPSGYMVWYEKNKESARNDDLDGEKIPKAVYDISSLREIHRHSLNKGLTLVRTNIPHTIECGDLPRWCVSMRVPYGRFGSWKEAFDFFQDLNLKRSKIER